MGTETAAVTAFALSWIDFSVLGILLVGLILIGYVAGSKKQTTDTFFLARREIPWWAAGLSFIAAEVSAVTLISVPATAYRENLEYAQFFIGSTAARIIIAYLFIPAFYQYNCTTIYEFLLHRFGPQTQYTATIFFFITRLLGSGVRLMVASMAVSILLGWHVLPTIIVFSLVSLAYIMYGGIASVVWTGVYQAGIFIAAGLATIAFLLMNIDGGWRGFVHVAEAAGKLKFWNWGPSAHEAGFWAKFFADPNIVWIAVLNGLFGSLAAFGTDHELMQRLLTVETRAKSQRTMILTPLASAFVLAIFMMIGSCLYVFYAQHPTLALPEKLDTIFPHFISHSMPALMRGFLLGAVVMAAIDSPLASLTASFVTDIYRPLFRRDAEDRHYLWVSRLSVAVFGVILAAIAYGFSFYQNFLWLAFKIGGVTFGSLLGVFLLGFLTKRHANRSNTVGMVTMACVNAVLLILSEKKVIPLGWTYLMLIGTAGTMLIGYYLAPVLDRPKAAAQA
jgi:solute:Na+ symporter, SSS family